MPKLLIENFTTQSGNAYIFDAVTSTVIANDGSLDKILERMEKNQTAEEIFLSLKDTYNSSCLNSSLIFAQRWKTKVGGFFLEEEKLNPSFSFIEQYNAERSAGLGFVLVINLTEDCNFRCKYCYLSESYAYTHNRTNSTISFEIGIKAISQYFEYLADVKKRIPSKKAAITFYGGEPLLEINLIREFVKYIEQYSPVPIEINMTSNGYLLTDEIIDFIVEHEINLAISFDGVQKDHDRNRVLPNDIGSFSKVRSNIARFVAKYPNYSRLGLVPVYDILTNVEGNIAYFENEQLPKIIFLNEVSNHHTTYYDSFTDDDYRKFFETFAKLKGDYIDAKQKGQKMSDYLQMMFELRLLTTVLRSKKEDRRSPLVSFTGACVPGMRLSVRTNGTYDVCERINQNFPIGDVFNGIDYPQIENMLSIYNREITDKCRECVAYRQCPLCYAYTCDDKIFSKPDDFCENWRKTSKDNLSTVYSILEKNPLAFSNLQNCIEKYYTFIS